MSAAEDIVSVLLYGDRGLCAECVASKTGLTYDEVMRALSGLTRQIKIHHRRQQCFRCSRDAEVFSLVG